MCTRDMYVYSCASAATAIRAAPDINPAVATVPALSVSSSASRPLAVADLLAVLRAFAAEGVTAPLSGEVGSRLKAAHPTRFK